MPVFTLYAFGTGESWTISPDKKNCISAFSQHTDPAPTQTLVENPHIRMGQEGHDVSLAIEGPGVLGKEIPANVEKSAEKIVAWLKEMITNPEIDAPINLNLVGFSRGSVTCQQILHAVEKELGLEGDGIKITGDKFDKASKKLHSLRILLYANDPVAGLSDKKVLEKIFLPEMKIKLDAGNQVEVVTAPVDHIGTVQEDEMRRDFKPQDKSRLDVMNHETTNSSLLPMYGNHSDSVKYKSEALADCVEINSNLMYRALKAHGTQFKEHEILVQGETVSTTMPPLYGCLTEKLASDWTLDLIKLEEEDKVKSKKAAKPSGFGKIFFAPLNDKQLLEHFAKAKQNRKAYEISGKKFKLVDGVPFWSKIRRSFVDQRELYVDGSHFFLNQFERELFKKEYPHTFNYLFERGMRPDGTVPDEEQLKELKIKMSAELAQMTEKQNNPELFKSLRSLGVYVSKKTHSLCVPKEPKGQYKLELSPLAAAIEGRSAKSDVYSGDHNYYAEQMALLEKEVVQTTLRYERDKKEIMAFYDRAHTSEAAEIRTRIKKISNENALPEVKYKKALEYLSKRFTELYQAGVKSNLNDRIAELLEKHGYYHGLSKNPGKLRRLTVMLGNTMGFFSKGFFVLGNFLGTVTGVPGAFIEDIGRRLDDFGVPIIGTLIEAVGFVIKKGLGIPALLNGLGKGIEKVSQAVVRSSGFYCVGQATVTIRIPPAATLEALGVNKTQAERQLQKTKSERSPSQDQNKVASPVYPSKMPTGQRDSAIEDETPEQNPVKSHH